MDLTREDVLKEMKELERKRGLLENERESIDFELRVLDMQKTVLNNILEDFEGALSKHERGKELFKISKERLKRLEANDERIKEFLGEIRK